MLHHMLFCKRQLDSTKCHYTEEDLGGALDELAVLLQLGAHAHVAELVSNSDHHAANEVGVHAPVDKSLLLALKEPLDGPLHLLLHGGIQGLGGGHTTHDLAAVCG